MKTKIRIGKLLPILKENRKKHYEVYLEAVEGYRKAVIKQLEEHIERIKAGKKIQSHISFITPVNQVADYDRVIAMLDMSEDPDIVLDENQFRCYVQDQWSWAQQFSASNKVYTTSAAAQEYIRKMEGEEEE